MKKWTRMIAAASVLGLVLAGCGEKDNNDNPKVEINIKDYGTIKAELNPEQAPITVENFISLAEEGFYDGLTFHRIMDGFMMQGGDGWEMAQGVQKKRLKVNFLKMVLIIPFHIKKEPCPWLVPKLQIAPVLNFLL